MLSNTFLDIAVNTNLGNATKNEEKPHPCIIDQTASGV